MKKLLALVLALVLSLGLLAACGGSSEPAQDDTQEEDGAAAQSVTLRVAASPTPHAEILNSVKEALAAEGVTLEVVEFTDYIQPNLATEGGDVDANYFQHGPYLDNFNVENDTHLVSVAAIHYEPFGIYAGKTASLDEIPDGAQIAVPNDATNEARALLLLEANGIITLNEGAGLEATKLDIAENPHNVEIIEIEAAQLARSLADVDFAAINVNYALQAGLKVSEALVTEDKTSEAAETYANILVVKEGNENNEAVQKLVKALTSEETRKFIEDTYAGEVVPMF